MLTYQNNKKPSLPLLRFTIWDGLVAGIVLAAALGLLVWKPTEAGQVCRITWEQGETVLSLDTDTVFSLESGGISLTVSVSDGSVFVSEAGCPDGVCMGTGKISRAGEIIVCVPAGVVIRIPSESDGSAGNTEDIRVG